jgi:hypothetical protein
MTPDDDDLRRAFADLRRSDAATAPGYERVLSRVVPRGRSGRGLAVLASASVVAAVLAGLAIRRPDPSPLPAVSLEGWTGPTDFLLETPGQEILHGEPGIGTGERTLTP